MLTLEQDIENSRRIMEQRTKGWQEIYSGIENANNRLEFRRSGSITYDLVTKEFGKEKGVDTQLSTDLIELSGIYDVAIQAPKKARADEDTPARVMWSAGSSPRSLVRG
jgi:hypothetical protein